MGLELGSVVNPEVQFCKSHFCGICLCVSNTVVHCVALGAEGISNLFSYFADRKWYSEWHTPPAEAGVSIVCSTS